MNIMSDLVKEKDALRRVWRAKRDVGDACERAQSDAALADELTGSWEWDRARALFAYASFGSEVATRTIVERAFERGMRVLAPRTLGRGREGRSMAWYLVPTFDAWCAMLPSTCGICEPDPRTCTALTAESGLFAHGLALVPGLVFDRQGFRLGYGGGCYDAFLPAFRSAGGCAVGLARMDQLIEADLPREPFDIPVDLICTDDGLIYPQARTERELP